MKKYKVKIPFGNVEVGTVLEHTSDNFIRYQTTKDTDYGAVIYPHDLALMLHNGFLEEVDGKWKLNKGEKYWYINSVIEVSYYIYNDDSMDKKQLESGNYFRTEAEAQAKLEEVLKVLGK